MGKSCNQQIPNYKYTSNLLVMNIEADHVIQ